MSNIDNQKPLRHWWHCLCLPDSQKRGRDNPCVWCTSHVLRSIPHWSPGVFLFTISLKRPIDWLYAFLCQRPNPEPCVCQAGALPLIYISSPSYSEARFHYVAQATSNSWLMRWGFSHTPLCPADTSSQHCSKKAFRAKAAGAGCVFQLLTAGSALAPAMLPCSSIGISQQCTDSKQSWPWEWGSRKVLHRSVVYSWSLRQLNKDCLFLSTWDALYLEIS